MRRIILGILLVIVIIMAVIGFRLSKQPVADENGNQLYLYGVYDSSGASRYDKMSDPPKIGDKIVICGKVTNYVDQTGTSIIEIKSARVISKS